MSRAGEVAALVQGQSTRLRVQGPPPPTTVQGPPAHAQDAACARGGACPEPVARPRRSRRAHAHWDSGAGGWERSFRPAPSPFPLAGVKGGVRRGLDPEGRNRGWGAPPTSGACFRMGRCGRAVRSGPAPRGYRKPSGSDRQPPPPPGYRDPQWGFRSPSPRGYQGPLPGGSPFTGATGTPSRGLRSLSRLVPPPCQSLPKLLLPRVNLLPPPTSPFDHAPFSWPRLQPRLFPPLPAEAPPPPQPPGSIFIPVQPMGGGRGRAERRRDGFPDQWRGGAAAAAGPNGGVGGGRQDRDVQWDGAD